MTAPIEIATAADGSRFYRLAGGPAALPAVRARDLEACWQDAHDLARRGEWGVARSFRFERAEGFTDIALTDEDARCWAEAVDRRADLGTRHGLSLCLRLLALVDLLAHAPTARHLVRLAPGPAALHPRLLTAAARAVLDETARFAPADIVDELRGGALARPAAACDLLGPAAG